jgi:hypothetical protein
MILYLYMLTYSILLGQILQSLVYVDLFHIAWSYLYNRMQACVDVVCSSPYFATFLSCISTKILQGRFYEYR